VSAYYHDLSWEAQDGLGDRLAVLGWVVEVATLSSGPILKIHMPQDDALAFEALSPVFCFNWRTVALLVETVAGPGWSDVVVMEDLYG